MLDDKFVQAVLTVVIAVAALNWTLVEFSNTNLLTDTLSLATGSSEYQAVVAIIGASAAVRLVSVSQWVMED